MYIIQSSLFLGAKANSRFVSLKENQVTVIYSRDRLLFIAKSFIEKTSVKNVYNQLSLFLGATAYSRLASLQENQVIVISGESGAGKTESTKLIMQVSLIILISCDLLFSKQRRSFLSCIFLLVCLSVRCLYQYETHYAGQFDYFYLV